MGMEAAAMVMAGSAKPQTTSGMELSAVPNQSRGCPRGAKADFSQLKSPFSSRGIVVILTMHITPALERQQRLALPADMDNTTYGETHRMPMLIATAAPIFSLLYMLYLRRSLQGNRAKAKSQNAEHAIMITCQLSWSCSPLPDGGEQCPPTSHKHAEVDGEPDWPTFPGEHEVPRFGGRVA